MSSDTANNFIAHTREWDGKNQTVLEHLQGVARLSQQFASKINLPESGRLIGLMHDLGKYSASFQRYIGEGGIRGEVDHATAGAQEIWTALSATGNPVSLGAAQILAACTASHHTGLYDFVDQNGDSPFLTRINKSKKHTFAEEALLNCDSAIRREFADSIGSNAVLNEFKTIFCHIENSVEIGSLRRFHLGLLLRFLFSCLIDADRLDTANFEKPDSADFRNTNTITDWTTLKNTLEAHLTTLECNNRIDELRNDISKYCLEASSRSKGIFFLTVPTGGGKTLASLRFACHHAQTHSLSGSPIERIIYVIPYTTIIEQNADAVRKILGNENVLEHHSNLVPENDTWRGRLLSENWDAPIVFTTSVQFLNALFGSSTRGVRRMHQLANAIIIFDEVQTLPIKTIHLFNNAINFLTQTCGSSVVLCTATQPLLNEVKKEFGVIQLNSYSTIIPDNAQLFEKLRRTEIKDRRKPGGWSVQDVADLAIQQAKENGSTLVIVNTKQSALALYKELQDNECVKIYHLSTNMCPAHRKKTLATIRANLKPLTQPIICISTQLIEAGVDIDFGSVIRYLAGLDSIAQAAGRCNRHGHRKTGLAPVFVINPSKENIENLPDICKGQEVARRILDDYLKDPRSLDNDLLSPQAMRQFYRYYFFDRARDMTYPIQTGTKGNKIVCDTTLLDLLSLNEGSVEEYKRIKKSCPPFLFRQAFKTAYESFRVIDAPTEGIIVPYGDEGRWIINELVAACDQPECAITTYQRLLRRAQQYSVNVFPHQLKKLDNNGCIHEVQKGSGIYYLDERHYNATTGITLEETMEMTFLNV